MPKAVYAYSGDPTTNGHVDVVRRALSVFNHVVVAIGVNPKKKYTFSLEEREEMAHRTFHTWEKGGAVSVVSFRGLLVDFAYENGIKTIIRGLRNSSDFNYEQVINDVNASQDLGIDTMFLCAKPSLAHVSSSAVKELQTNGGDISEYVPVYVKRCLEEKISGYRLIGVTGEIGAGKTFIVNKFAEAYNTGVVELDQIGRYILTEAQEPLYRQVRQQLIGAFGQDIITDHMSAFISPQMLGNKIFSSKTAIDTYNKITKDPIIFCMRQKIRDLAESYEIMLVTSALLVEANLVNFCNNRVVLIGASKEVRADRLKARGYDDDQVKKRMNAQLSSNSKLKNIYRYILKSGGYGDVCNITNDENSTEELDKNLQKMAQFIDNT